MSCPCQGDLIWVDFSPSIGHEQAMRRPALVVSCDEFNRNMGGLVVAVPITSKKKKRTDEVELPAGLQVSGVLLLSQIKTLDLAARPHAYADHAPDDFMDNEVLGRITAIFTG